MCVCVCVCVWIYSSALPFLLLSSPCVPLLLDVGGGIFRSACSRRVPAKDPHHSVHQTKQSYQQEVFVPWVKRKSVSPRPFEPPAHARAMPRVENPLERVENRDEVREVEPGE